MYLNVEEIQVSFAWQFVHKYSSFRANDTRQLPSADVHGTWQWSTLDFNRVDHCLVLCCSANCDFRCLVPANVAAAAKDVTISFWNQISSVLWGPAVRTLCPCWDHQDCWATRHVTNCTWSWIVSQWISAVVNFGEYVVASVIMSWIEQFIFHAVDGSSPSLISIEVSFPLWIFRQTQEVAAAATFGVMWPCCVSLTTVIMFSYTLCLKKNKNLAIANRSRVSWADNTLRASIGINIRVRAFNRKIFINRLIE